MVGNVQKAFPACVRSVKRGDVYYADFGSDRAFDFFNEIIEDELNSVVPDVDVKDNKQYVDKTHTIEEYNEAINEIIRTLKAN